MNAKEILLLQLSACHDQNTWFVSLLNSLDGLTEEEAQWKPTGTTNSIFEIINHLIYYNQRYLNRVKGLPNPEVVESNDESFNNLEELTWAETTTRITNLMTEWKETVAAADEQTIEKWSTDIAHLANHALYHTGQILYIRKLQESWDPKNGVH
ncbi:DinB family protein [Robertmurraya sp. Marseille-Q9965]